MKKLIVALAMLLPVAALAQDAKPVDIRDLEEAAKAISGVENAGEFSKNLGAATELYVRLGAAQAEIKIDQSNPAWETVKQAVTDAIGGVEQESQKKLDDMGFSVKPPKPVVVEPEPILSKPQVDLTEPK